MISATQMRPGMVIKYNNELYTVFSVNHRTPGNLRGFVQAKMRNLRSGSIIDYRFRAEDFVERATLDEIEFEFLYQVGSVYKQMKMVRVGQARIVWIAPTFRIEVQTKHKIRVQFEIHQRSSPTNFAITIK